MKSYLSGIIFGLIHLLAWGQSTGFRTWDSRSACAWVEPESGLHFQLHFKKVHRNQERFLSEVRIGAREKEAEVVRPMGHAPDGTYTGMEMDWQDESLLIESAQESQILILRIIKRKKTDLPLRLFLSGNVVWGRSDFVKKESNSLLTGKLAARSPQNLIFEPCLPAMGPNLGVEAGDTSYFYVSPFDKTLSTKALAQKLEEKKKNYYATFNLKEDKDLARFAIQTCMAWNTIFDPGKNRKLHTVNRIWNVNRGGYVIFCWDNFFGSLLSLYGLNDTALAFSNFKAVLEDFTPEGFPSNNSQGNGRKAYDRSQPPVGGLVALDLFEKTGSTAFAKSVFEPLFTWNRWWLAKRKNGSLLSWGSHVSQNPFADPAFNNLKAAKLESGLDDSPMFDSAGFEPTSGLMMLHDVGLNALYLADCESLLALIEKAGLPFAKEKKQLEESVSYFSKAIQKLFHPELKVFVNRYCPENKASRIFSPTHLYPLLTSSGLKKWQAQLLIDSLLLHPQRFATDFPLPSIARSHPDFEKQQYWKGSVWPPLNFLVFKGLMKQNRKNEAQTLARSSFGLFMNEYKRAKLICENYSGMNGRCDDPLVNSEPYYFWGGLLAYLQTQL